MKSKQVTFKENPKKRKSKDNTQENEEDAPDPQTKQLSLLLNSLNSQIQEELGRVSGDYTAMNFSRKEQNPKAKSRKEEAIQKEKPAQKTPSTKKWQNGHFERKTKQKTQKEFNGGSPLQIISLEHGIPDLYNPKNGNNKCLCPQHSY